MEKKTIEQLLEMSGKDLRAYLMALPEAERQIVDDELDKAMAGDTVKKMTDNLNRNVLIEQIAEMSGIERRKYLLALTPAERAEINDKELLKAVNDRMLKGMVNNLNNNVKADQDELIKP